MTRVFAALGAGIFFACAAYAQPPGISREMIMRQLPLEGAPLAATLELHLAWDDGHVVLARQL